MNILCTFYSFCRYIKLTILKYTNRLFHFTVHSYRFIFRICLTTKTLLFIILQKKNRNTSEFFNFAVQKLVGIFLWDYSSVSNSSPRICSHVLKRVVPWHNSLKSTKGGWKTFSIPTFCSHLRFVYWGLHGGERCNFTWKLLWKMAREHSHWNSHCIPIYSCIHKGQRYQKPISCEGSVVYVWPCTECVDFPVKIYLFLMSFKTHKSLTYITSKTFMKFSLLIFTNTDTKYSIFESKLSSHE